MSIMEDILTEFEEIDYGTINAMNETQGDRNANAIGFVVGLYTFFYIVDVNAMNEIREILREFISYLNL